MRPAAACALGAFLCLLGVGCGGANGGWAPTGAAPGSGKTLEELWRAPGDDVAIIPGTKTYVPGDVRVSFIVADSKGRIALAPTARVLVSHALGEPPFRRTTATL